MTAYLYTFILFALVLIVAITIHEFSHAWVAYKLGDPTAKNQGRLSFNPMRHLDPIGTLMIFIAKIGWGKPVPVNPMNLRNHRRDNALISAAGPLSNLLTAIIASYPYKFFLTTDFPFSTFLSDFFGYFIMISVILCLFNLLPFKPLDGAGILSFFIPRKHVHRFEHFMERHMGHFLAFVVIDTFLIGEMFGKSILSIFILTPAQYIIQFIMLG